MHEHLLYGGKQFYRQTIGYTYPNAQRGRDFCVCVHIKLNSMLFVKLSMGGGSSLRVVRLLIRAAQWPSVLSAPRKKILIELSGSIAFSKKMHSQYTFITYGLEQRMRQTFE